MRLAPMILLAGLATPAFSDIAVQFDEGAPKDRFRIANLSACDTGPVDITIDLAGSAAGLLFDTTERGQGVEVYQPVELESGTAILTEVTDGSQKLQLRMPDFALGDAITVSADLDDTMPNSNLGQIRVANSEIAGVTVSIETPGGMGANVIDASSQTSLSGALGCPQA